MVELNLFSAMFHKIDYPFLIGAFVSFVASVSLWFLVSHDYGLFVGIWVPSILSLWVGVRVVILSAGIQTRKGSWNMTLIFSVFALGVAVSLVILKGIMQANDFAREELEKLETADRDKVAKKQLSSTENWPFDWFASELNRIMICANDR